MRRASYREAIRWIALNDSAAEETAFDPKVVSELVTAVLVADIFDVPSDKVGADIVRQREKELGLERPLKYTDRKLIEAFTERVDSKAMTAAEVRKWLERRQFKVLRHTEPNETEDGAVELTETLHVQVGVDGSLNITEQQGDEWLIGLMTYSLPQIESDLRAALARAGKPWPETK